MVSREWAAALDRYNRWMNRKVFALAGTLSDEVRKRDAGAFFKSIHGTLNHILIADRVWMGRLQGVVLPDGLMGPGIASLDQDLCADFGELSQERERTDQEISRWIAGVTESDLATKLRFVRRGVQQEAPLWSVIAHMFNHQTHHRGQVTTLFMQFGHDPGVTDLYAMLREEAQPKGAQAQ